MSRRTRTRDPKELVEAARDRDRGALARLISFVEEGGEVAREVGRLTFPLAGNAYTVGITGPTGSGKSTLTEHLISLIRAAGDQVGVLAVDPSSPFSGGAFLGDRVRMQSHATDEAVFIRSMATRGHLGGLSLATPEAIRVLDGAGIPWVLVETVGVGQVEIEIASSADTTVVVVPPVPGTPCRPARRGSSRRPTCSSSTRPIGPARPRPSVISRSCSTYPRPTRAGRRPSSARLPRPARVSTTSGKRSMITAPSSASTASW